MGFKSLFKQCTLCQGPCKAYKRATDVFLLVPPGVDQAAAYTRELVGYDVFGNIHGPDEAQVVGEIPSIIAARGVDAVVAGVGA